MWTTPTDVRWCKGDMDGLSGSTTIGAGSLAAATSLAISGDSPAPGTGIYYLVRQQGCGSWQTELGGQRRAVTRSCRCPDDADRGAARDIERGPRPDPA